MLKRIQKAFAVLERLAVAKKEDYKTLTKALSDAFGADENGKHLAEEDIQVFAYYLEALLRRVMLKMEKGDGGYFSSNNSLKERLWSWRSSYYNDRLYHMRRRWQLHSSWTWRVSAEPAMASSLLVTQLMANIDTPTRKVSELPQSVANIKCHINARLL